MPEVTKSAEADDDLVELLFHIGRHSPAAADRLRWELAEEFERLARFPRLGRPRPDLGPGVYSRAVAHRVVVYYYITDDGIMVARVLPGSSPASPSMFPG